MSFWELLSGLPVWFQMCFLTGLFVGLFFVLSELANRKMKISKEGITFDRLREKKGFIFRLLEMRNNKKNRDKIKIEDL